LKVILTKYHEKLGDIGDEVEVKAGYANNYLIPNDMAIPATPGSRNQMKLVKQAAVKIEAKNIKEAEALAKEFEGLQVKFIVKTGEEGKLYGSITNKDIAEKIFEEKKTEIDRKKIDLEEHIKELGEYDIELKVYKEVKASIKVNVEPDEESRELIEAYKARKEKEKEENPEEEEKKEKETDKEEGKKVKEESRDKKNPDKMEKEEKKEKNTKTRTRDK
jgi:large subunit ribosomal protein L9